MAWPQTVRVYRTVKAEVTVHLDLGPTYSLSLVEATLYGVYAHVSWQE